MWGDSQDDARRRFILKNVRDIPNYAPSRRFSFDTALAVANGHLDFDAETSTLSLTEAGERWLKREEDLILGR